MPRTYIKKKTQKYDEDSLKEAVKEVDNGSSVYAAARLKLANPVQDLPGPSSSVAGLPEISPSPMKKLREAILSTLSPEQSSSIKDALKNSKTKRRRVQGSCGEVMTTNEVMDRLKEEEDARKEKIKSKTNRPKPITALGKTIKQEPGLVQAKPQKKPRATKRLFDTAESDDESSLPKNVKPTEPTVGSWVGINYQSECGTVVKEYRGQITAQDLRNKERYSVKFLTKCKGEGERYIFPDKEDIEWVDLGQISNVFSVPDYNGRFFKFV
ncbi:uncharacterized protein LOC124364243 [Homalodisca vitripennis]|nr:uncharacterized protein LOC124364243 [Homalodisca vitripennis]